MRGGQDFDKINHLLWVAAFGYRHEGGGYPKAMAIRCIGVNITILLALPSIPHDNLHQRVQFHQ